MAHTHISGVCGIGMSAIAQVLVARGHEVSGSDRRIDEGTPGVVAEALRQTGVALCPQDGSGVTPDTARLVVSSAIEPGNPDLAAAQAHEIPVQHRSECLAELISGARTIGVTGTSGKSTVTAMIGWVLEVLGADPTVINGAVCPAWQGTGRIGNVRMGQGDLCVFEADESDRSVSTYTVDWAVVTNASHDHFAVDEARDLFMQFAERAREGTINALSEECRPDPAYGVPMPGRHNQANAGVAGVVCERLGYAPAEIAEALSRFPGLHRRLERVGEHNGITVYDDYAHNPAKIEAAWKAVRGTGRVIGAWRPHGYGPLRGMRDELGMVFSDLTREGDRLYILPVYDAGGTADRSEGAEALLARVPGADVVLPEDLPERMATLAQPGDVVLVMGARDPGLPAIARRVSQRLAAH